MINTSKINKNLKILTFTAHPDDHISCSGTLLRLNTLGFELYECLFTNGEASAYIKDGIPQGKDKQGELIEVRSQEFNNASKILGTKEVFLLGELDRQLSRSFTLLLRVVEIIRKVKPFIVFMHADNDYHSDHQVVYEVCQEALRFSNYSSYPELGTRYRVPIALCYENLFLNNPSIIIDVTEFQATKQKILDCYTSQIHKNSTSYKIEEAIPTYRAYQRSTVEKYGQSGKAAEGFTIPEKYPIAGDELLELLSQFHD